MDSTLTRPGARLQIGRASDMTFTPAGREAARDRRNLPTRTCATWLRAIGDCVTLRVPFDDDALMEAIDLGLVDAAPVDSNEDALDCRLTEAGQRALQVQEFAR